MMAFPAHFVSNLQARRARSLRTCYAIVPTVARAEAACWQHKVAGRRSMRMMEVLGMTMRKSSHSCVLISADAARSCGETSEKGTYLL